MNGWDFILNLLSFTGVEDTAVWQDVFISAIIIPLVILVSNQFFIWWNCKKPSHLVFKNCMDEDQDVFIHYH